jgi:hypothetical protein
MLKFAFITTRRTNVGDDFVRTGLRAVLDEICPYHSYIVNKHDPDQSCITQHPEDDGPIVGDKILDADVTFQSGAPVYWNLGEAPGHKCSTAEWVDPLWYRRIAPNHLIRPLINVAAGACQPYYGSANTIVEDPSCNRFIRDIHSYSRLTIVRDKMAEDVHKLLGLPVFRLPCASIHAWRRYKGQTRIGDGIALNFMPLGGHYDLDGKMDPDRWQSDFLRIDELLRKSGSEVRLVAHNRAELDAISRMFPGRTIFFSEDYEDYFGFYAGCRGGILNRVHGAMLLAGKGCPAVVIGNDSRAWMADELSLPRWHVSEIDPEVAVGALIERLDDPDFRANLVNTERTTFTRVKALLTAALQETLASA